MMGRFLLTRHPPMDTGLAPACQLSGVVLLRMWVHTCLFKTLLSSLLSTHPEVGLLGHVVVVFLMV